MNWQYIAGFIDGEGTIFIKNNRFRITVTQTNKEVSMAIKDFALCGNVAEITKRKSHWNDCWVYYVCNIEDIYNFLAMTLPFLIVKKEAALYALSYLKEELPKMRKKKEAIEERRRVARALREDGLSYREIGKKLKVDWGYVRRLILKI